MRNKKNKGDGGAAAAAAAATTASPSGASNTSCYLQVREKADRKKGAGEREKRFFCTREKKRPSKTKPPRSSVRARFRREVSFDCLDLSRVDIEGVLV